MFDRHHFGPTAAIFATRFKSRGGFDSFGPGPGGPRGGPFRFGRLLRDGDLRLVALALMEQSPRHGYDIIKALEEKSGGYYSPSPGVVYPTLTFLEEVGYATSAPDGNKKVFTIADPGRAYLDENREQVEAIFEEMEAFGQKMGRATEMWNWTEREEEKRSAAPEKNETMDELERARRRLRALIVAATEGTDADQKRVAEILDRASNEILGQGGKS